MSNEFNNEFDTAFSAGFADNGGGGVTMFDLTRLSTRSITRDMVRSLTRGFQPSYLPGLVMWCRFNSGITVTGAGVSQWNDVSGQDNHLKQGTDTNRPSEEGDGSILFDGIDNWLRADPFTLDQPETIYLLFKQVTWANSDRFFDGNTVNAGVLFQNGSSADITAYAGSFLPDSSDLALDTYSTAVVVFNSTSSLYQINNLTPITGDAGTNDMGGFVLGANGGDTNWSHIQVKEVVVYNQAHDSNTRSRVIKYLAHVGNLSI